MHNSYPQHRDIDQQHSPDVETQVLSALNYSSQEAMPSTVSESSNKRGKWVQSSLQELILKGDENGDGAIDACDVMVPIGELDNIWVRGQYEWDKVLAF